MQNKIERVALRDLIHRDLLGRILHGQLPPGSRVKDTDLTEELKVSRTPVREALVRLVKEGFLENLVGRGFIVQPFTSREVQEIYPIIWTLEILALQTSAPLPAGTGETFKQISLEMAAPQEDFIPLIQLDQRWHNTLLSGCSNRRLLDMIGDLKAIAFRYEYAYMQDQALVKSSIQEHKDIAHALLHKDIEAAADLLKSHWEATMHALLKKLAEG